MTIDFDRLDRIARETSHRWEGTKAEYDDWLVRFGAAVVRECAALCEDQTSPALSANDLEGDAYNAGVSKCVEALMGTAHVLDPDRGSEQSAG